MGFFDNKSSQSTSLQMPEWLEGMPQTIVDRMMQLMDRPDIAPQDRIAAYDPAQQDAINSLINWGGEGGGGTIFDNLMGGADAYGEGLGFMQGVMGEDAPQNMGVNMDNVMSYIDNDILQGQIDASLRDVERTFAERDAPMSRLNQALSGNSNSTRGAIGDAVLQRGAMDRAGDISGMMRGGAYNTALGIGANEAAQNASLVAGNQNLRMGGGNQMAGFGLAGNQMANSIGLGNINAMMQGGGLNQAYEQALNDVEFQNWMRDYKDVGMGSDIFTNAAQTYGTTTTDQTSSPSPFSRITAVLSTMMGMPGGGGSSFDPAGMNTQGFFDNLGGSSMLPTS